MKLPVPPPPFAKLLNDLLAGAHGADRFDDLMHPEIGAAPGGKYRHWDTFRHAPPSQQFTAEEQ